jgi:hypothetical protein
MPKPLVRHAQLALFKLNIVLLALDKLSAASRMLLIAPATRVASTAPALWQLSGAEARHGRLR